MKKWLGCGGAALVAAVVGGVLIFTLLAWFIGLWNTEARLRAGITAQQRNIANILDKTNKEIKQSGQVTETGADSLQKLVTGYAEARTGTGGGGKLVTAIHEAIPNVDPSSKLFLNLQNIISNARTEFAASQKDLLSRKEQHDALMDGASGQLLALVGKNKIDVTIVTSSRTEEAMATGKDDDVDVFSKKPAEAK